MDYTYEELKKKTVAQLRKIASGVEHEAVKGYTQMHKEHLTILDICFGLGFNTLATLYYMKHSGIDKKITIYLEENEKISIISSYVRNSPPIFRYYDENGEELPVPARKKDTKLLEVYLVINVDPQRKPDDVEILDGVEIRNLRITF